MEHDVKCVLMNVWVMGETLGEICEENEGCVTYRPGVRIEGSCYRGLKRRVTKYKSVHGLGLRVTRSLG